MSARPALYLALALTVGGCSSSGTPDPAGPGDGGKPEAGPPVAMQIIGGDGQSAVVGTELPAALVVRLTDDQGRGVPARSITFAVARGGGSLFVSASTTNPAGEAATRWTLGTLSGAAQTTEARIVVPETGVGLVRSFTATGTADEPASVVLHGGDNQVGAPARTLELDLEVLVRDRYSNPVPGAEVHWDVVAGGGALSPGVSTSNEEGVASTSWIVGPVEGTAQEATATLPDVGTVSFRALLPPPANYLLSEDFENGLGNWTGRSTGHHAELVPDPFDPDNTAVRFWKPVAAGDLFSQEITVEADRPYILTFDYLGLPELGGVSGDLGGFVGISDGIPGVHAWIGGTDPRQAPYELVDDGTWHTYSIVFVPADFFTPSDGKVRVMIEDGEVSGGVPRDVYFDNISLRPAN